MDHKLLIWLIRIHKKKYGDQKLDTKKLKDELEEIKIKNKVFKENTEEQEKKANFFLYKIQESKGMREEEEKN